MYVPRLDDKNTAPPPILNTPVGAVDAALLLLKETEVRVSVELWENTPPPLPDAYGLIPKNHEQERTQSTFSIKGTKTRGHKRIGK